MSTSSGAAPVSPYDWIAFSIGRAKWVPFRTDREIDRAFNAPMPAADASHGPSSNYKLRLKNALEDLTGTSLPGTLLFDYPTIDAISNYLIDEVLEIEGDRPLVAVVHGEVACPRTF